MGCGWNHIFSSLWFIIPLAALCINCIFCLGSRLFFLSTVLRLEKKGRAGVAGSFLLHTGFLFLVAGGIVHYYFGDTQSVIVPEGTQEFVEKFNLKIFLHDFSIIKNSKGETINYRSDLEVRDTNNNPLIRAEAMVNAPLTYHGLYFYQMRYGLMPNAVKRLRAVVVDSSGDTLFSGTIPYKTDFPLGKTAVSLACSDFLCDFYYDFENRMPMTRSHEHSNPAFKVTLSRNGKAVDSQWLFQKFPSMGGKFGRYSTTISNYEPLFYSGIQVQKKPGTTYILGGIISVSMGLVLVFLYPFRRRN
jgi:cytochrome c biogenesis protein ResB